MVGMAYDEGVAQRIRDLVQGDLDVTEKRMFGGLAFLVNGNLAVSASSRGGLLLRVDPRETESLLSPPHVRRFEMRGRELDGWLGIDAEVVEADEELQRWVDLGVAFASSLPAK
jgi:TfoX/Sxy family transcriptional regulator of competence genes